jgi:hypothetical protein
LAVKFNAAIDVTVIILSLECEIFVFNHQDMTLEIQQKIKMPILPLALEIVHSGSQSLHENSGTIL